MNQSVIPLSTSLSLDKKSHGDSKPLIVLSQVVKVYHGVGEQVQALKGIDLAIMQGEFLVVTGRSGSGKTTLVNMIAGLDRCSQGEIWVSGTAVHHLSTDQLARWRGKTVGVVFQSFELLPSLTILQNVILPMDLAHLYSRRKRVEIAMDLLAKMEIADHAHKRPWAISGGQQQRVAIARALANHPQVLIADEPTGSLDSSTAASILDLFSDLVKQGTTIILVSHEREIAHWSTRAIQLSDGRVIDD